MRCDEVRELLTAARYERREPEGEVDAHLRTCGECLAFADQAEALDQLLATEEAQPPRPGFDARFFARLDEERAARRGGLLTRLRWGLAGLAGVAAAAAVLFLVMPPEPTAPEAEGLELELAMNLELARDLALLQQLDEVEAYEVLHQLEPEELDQLLAEGEDQR